MDSCVLVRELTGKKGTLSCRRPAGHTVAIEVDLVCRVLEEDIPLAVWFVRDL